MDYATGLGSYDDRQAMLQGIAGNEAVLPEGIRAGRPDAKRESVRRPRRRRRREASGRPDRLSSYLESIDL